MTRVLLLHGGLIPHYRVPIYVYLSNYLRRCGFDLVVASDGVQEERVNAIDFEYVKMPLSALRIAKLVYRRRIDVVVLFVDMRHLYLFPTYLIAKGVLGTKMVWWGQGRDLADRDATVKNLAYATEHALCDAIILYAEHLKRYVARRFHRKIFIANNTLYFDQGGRAPSPKAAVLAKYGITTKKNIISVGRLQKRKRLEHAVRAVRWMNRPDIGLILVGPDQEGILDGIESDNIWRLGPLYGADKRDVLSAADVYCLPGAVGLSIVDAFHYGLPFVTEDGDESAEIMYLRDGENGFVVPRGDIPEMARRLLLLLDNDELRQRFSDEARREVAEKGHIDRLCAGFRDALCYAVGSDGSQRRPEGSMRRPDGGVR